LFTNKICSIFFSTFFCSEKNCSEFFSQLFFSYLENFKRHSEKEENRKMKNRNQRTEKNKEKPNEPDRKVPEPSQNRNDQKNVLWVEAKVVSACGAYTRTHAAMYRICEIKWCLGPRKEEPAPDHLFVGLVS
jgi:hypothetical protein